MSDFGQHFSRALYKLAGGQPHEPGITPRLRGVMA
jgi:hypothetical protein